MYFVGFEFSPWGQDAEVSLNPAGIVVMDIAINKVGVVGYCGGNLTCEVGRQITHPGHLAIQSQYRLYSHLTISYLLIW